MKIALDVHGGDNAPKSNIKGAFNFLDQPENSDVEILLVGDKNQIKFEIDNLSRSASDVTIIHTTEVVEMGDKASKVLKEKPNSSLVKSIKLLKNKETDAVISAGNTGALLASSLFLIGKIPGIKRPALSPYIPTRKGGFILCDAGANADCKPQHLLQFGLMAEAYIEHLNNLINPKVALLNIGSEASKGNELTINTFPLLTKNINNFIGNIESRYIMEGKADVIICDGFTGNIILKLIEGTISHLHNWINFKIDNTNSDNNTLQVKKTLNEITSLLDHEEYGATPFLGINGVVMKCHGSSSSRAIENSLIATKQTVKEQVVQDITERLEKYSTNNDTSNNLSESTSV